MTSYGSRFLSHFERGRWMVEHMMRLGRMHGGGRRVLDVGCGFGWQSLMIAAIGRCEVVANDIRATMTQVVDARVRAVRSELPPGASVTTLLGDVCALRLPPASFDAIFCNQTVEHVHDLDRFFAAAARVLRPGGRMVIANDNNLLNRRQLAAVREMWRRRDRDWDYVRELKQDRPIENHDIEPYAVMRERTIRTANPSLAEPEVVRLADATSGLLDTEISSIARHHRPGGPVPTPPEFSWSRNPATGEYCERQLDPYELAKSIDRHGFRSRVRHAFRTLPLRLLNGVQFRPLNRLLFQRRSVFVIASERI